MTATAHIHSAPATAWRAPAVPAPALAVQRLRLSEFRSFGAAEFDCAPGPIVITGPNGAGKTHILEAISLLAPGRGLRGAKPSDLTRRGGNAPAAGWAVSADLTGAGLEPIRLGTGLSHTKTGRETRLFRLDGNTAKQKDVAALMRHVALTPAQDRLFDETPGARRRFFDDLVSALDAAHSTRLGRYDQARTERLRILRGELNEPAWLDGLEGIIAKEGIEIFRARRIVLASLQAELDLDGPWSDDQLFARGDLALTDGLHEAGAQALPPEADYRVLLRRYRARDAAAARTLIGPHLSDLRVRHRRKAIPAEMCSTGEQKALLIGLVLAHLRLIEKSVGRLPVVLLDSIDAHLDAERRQALFDTLYAGGAQVFLTGADETAFSALRPHAQFIHIRDGRLHA